MLGDYILERFYWSVEVVIQHVWFILQDLRDSTYVVSFHCVKLQLHPQQQNIEIDGAQC